jgi:galactokinase
VRLVRRLLEVEGGAASAARRESLPPLEVVRAPGRVNLIGEHTDYNEGFVLPAAIDLEIWIALRPLSGRVVELTSLDLGETASFDLDRLTPRDGRPGSWIDYVGGMAWALQGAGLPVRAFRGVLDSTVPVGSGLSSSAALEMAAARALLDPSAQPPPAALLASLGQRVENHYIGVQTGIMDQYASINGRAGQAMFLDCRSLEVRHIPLPADHVIVACHTGSPRRLESSEYNSRRADCEEGVRILAQRVPGVRALRDVDATILAKYRGLLPERVARRCEHVVRENARVLQTLAALEAGDLPAVGSLFAASHASLRDLFEVVSPELDAMVEIASAVPGVVAARMTGAGFGGCTVNIVREEAVGALRQAVLRRYPARTGLTPTVYVTRAVDGAGRLEPPTGGWELLA